MTMVLDFVVPSADVAPLITLLYHFQCEQPRFADGERAGHAQLRFRLRGRESRYRFADGTEQAVGAVHVVGPTTGPFHGTAAGPVEVLGFGLTPAGWAALMRSDAAAMVDRAGDAIALFDGIEAVWLAMRNAPTVAAKIALAEDFVRRAAAAPCGETLRFMGVVDAWLADEPSPRLETLEAAAGLSRRQVERRCNALYGAPPRLLARKYRALRAAVAVVADGAALDALLDRGFYDQSHLIREVRAFTGHTPGQLRANPSLLAYLTMTKRSALAGRVGPLVSAS